MKAIIVSALLYPSLLLGIAVMNVIIKVNDWKNRRLA